MSHHEFEGACHCGAIHARIGMPQPREALQVRSCQCAFCIRQASRTISDPAGRVELTIDGDHLGRYRFGTRTIDILLCTRCGAYAGAITGEDDNAWTTLNTRGLGIAGLEQNSLRKSFYQSESLEARWARRRASWTPTVVRWRNPTGSRGTVVEALEAEPVAGGCHCGAIRVELQTEVPACELPMRACQCGYCTRHGTMTTSDPRGCAVISVAGDRLGRYQFATRTAKSLFCRTCCVYVGAALEEDGRTWTALNVRGLGLTAFAERTPEAVSYEHESPADRNARRKQKWTPTTIRVHS